MGSCDGCYTPMDIKEDWNVREDDIYLDGDAKRTYQTAIGCLLY